MTPSTRTDLRAKDIMTPEPVCIDRDMTVSQIARLFEENEISGAPVIDGNGCLIGVISRTDLVREWLSGEHQRDPAVLAQIFAGRDDVEYEWMGDEEPVAEELMTEGAVSVTEETPIAEIAQQMVEARVHRVIVIDRLRLPVGIVTSLDLVKALAGV